MTPSAAAIGSKVGDWDQRSADILVKSNIYYQAAAAREADRRGDMRQKWRKDKNGAKIKCAVDGTNGTCPRLSRLPP
jgi:hypothetical protein